MWSAVINGHFVNFPQVTTIYRLDCICYTYPENIQDLTKQINILFVGSFKACNNDYSLPGGSFQVDPLSPKVHYPWEVRNAPTFTWPSNPGEYFACVLYDVGFYSLHALYVNIPRSDLTLSDVSLKITKAQWPVTIIARNYPNPWYNCILIYRLINFMRRMLPVPVDK